MLEFKYGITSLSYANIPKYASSNLPVLTKLLITGFIMFIGIENPIPSTSAIFIVLIPITSPFLFINGPPLFPGLMLASV